MPAAKVKNLNDPDERIDAPLVTASHVNVGGLTISRDVHQPGWRWSTHIKPVVGTEYCEVHHLGVVLSGRLHGFMADGTAFEFGPWDVVDIPAGHDAWVEGDEVVEIVSWRGARTWLEPLATMTERVLTTILLTDVSDSTRVAARMGDRAWGDLMGSHDEIVRTSIGRFRGRIVKLTGDGALAMFDSPARAVRCAVEIRAALADTGLTIRAAVNTGEIELAGDDIRGLVIHEASRMLSIADPGEVLVARSTHELARDPAIETVDRGEHELRGLAGTYRLYSIRMASPIAGSEA